MKWVSLNRKDFPVLNMYMCCEGGAVFTAEKDGIFYVITDESSMASLLSEEDKEDIIGIGNSLTSALEFYSAEERAAYLMKQFGPGKELQQYNRGVLQQLKTMGFRKIGEWKFEKDRLSFCVSHHYESANILYGFICQGSLVYLGKTDRPLEKHFWDVKYIEDSEGSRLDELIIKALLAGKPVEIHALPDNGLLYFGGFQVNLADGLFDSMILELGPAWN